MYFTIARFNLNHGGSWQTANWMLDYYRCFKRKKFSAIAYATSGPIPPREEVLLVVGGGAAGMFAGIRAKTVAPNLNVIVIEKGKPLSKVKISGGGRCNVTNGHCSNNMILADQYPRGNKELRGSFFNMHGPADTISWFSEHRVQLKKQKVANSYPSEFGLVKRFWKYLLDRKGLAEDALWASLSNDFLLSIASLLKQCSFEVTGKGQFKDEFVTAGGIPLSEISLKTMESRIQPHLFFAGEVLNVDGVTGGFNFQNAWSGGYIAGTSIGKLAASICAVVNEIS
ncbi:hypothetical protein Ancab_006191 [Ancistrocladus abbreviatus]